jgi:hypothetical protein
MPNSIFPYNWVSFHRWKDFPLPYGGFEPQNGAPVSVLTAIEKQYTIRQIVDLGRPATDHKYLKETGTVVLNLEHKIAYIRHSSRCHPYAMRAFEERIGFRPGSVAINRFCSTCRFDHGK